MDPVLGSLSGSIVIRYASPEGATPDDGATTVDPATVGSLSEVIEQAIVAEYSRLGLEVSVNVSLTRTDR